MVKANPNCAYCSKGADQIKPNYYCENEDSKKRIDFVKQSKFT